MTNGGRRETDHCAEHCILVDKWNEHIKTSENKAPLWSVMVLIGLVVSTLGFSYFSGSTIMNKLSEKMEVSNKEIFKTLTVSNQTIQSTLIKIQTDLAVAQSRQHDMKRLIEKHMTQNDRNITNR